MKYIILIIGTFISIEIFAQKKLEREIEFVVTVNKDTNQILDPIVVNFEIENHCDSVLSVNYPHPMSKYMNFTLYRNEKELVLNEWYVPGESNVVKLQPHKKQSYYIDINRIYPLIDEGNYLIKIKYYPFPEGNLNEKNEGEYISIDSINFIVDPLSLEEKEVKEYYYYMLNNCAEAPECIIANGERIIEKYPNSLFVKELKYKIGCAYTNLAEYDKSIEYFKDYLKEKGVLKVRENSTLWYMAWAFYKNKNINQALMMLEGIEVDNMNKDKVNNLIRRWREELNN